MATTCVRMGHAFPRSLCSDGIKDCLDGKDEKDDEGWACISQCKYKQPHPLNKFLCNDGQQISRLKKCDYFRDCVDGSDEMMCAFNTICKQGHFLCSNGQCITYALPM